MKRVLLAAILVFSLAGSALALNQDTPASKRADAIVNRARQLDLLNHILPLLLTKDQINKILPVIEKCRGKVKQVMAKEAENLKLVEIEVEKAYEDGIKKGAVPSRALLEKLNRLFFGFSILRNAAASENADDVYAVMKSCMNEGQLKVAANSIDIKRYNPQADTSKMSDEEKIKFFIKDVMLDPLSYDVLVALAKIAS